MGEIMEKEHEVLDKLISRAIVHYFKNVPVKDIIAKAYDELSDREKVIIDEKIDSYLKESIYESKRDIEQVNKVFQEAGTKAC